MAHIPRLRQRRAPWAKPLSPAYIQVLTPRLGRGMMGSANICSLHYGRKKPMIAAGRSNRQIADRLVIALSTVKTHINNCYGKLGVHSRTEAIARARELGLI